MRSEIFNESVKNGELRVESEGVFVTDRHGTLEDKPKRGRKPKVELVTDNSDQPDGETPSA